MQKSNAIIYNVLQHYPHNDHTEGLYLDRVLNAATDTS